VRFVRPTLSLALLGAVVVASSLAGAELPSFYAFESGPVRPLALSPDGKMLIAVNTPDDRIEIFRVTDEGLAHAGSVPVGMEPVAIAMRNDREAWVVNHLSDSVSIVRLDGQPRVVGTLLVGDEPRDIVFAGPGRGRAFITTAHRGQNSPFPRSEYGKPGVGRADVWVFKAAHPGGGLGGKPITVITLFGDKPRALAVTPDGKTVYAAVFHSGNRTTSLHQDLVCDGGASAPPCDVFGLKMPGGLPAPNENHEGATGPEVGLIVGFDPGFMRANGEKGGWTDELGRDWTEAVAFDLPDYDVFAIDAMAKVPKQSGVFASVGTILFNMAINPKSGALYVTNTEANNRVRFEGPGTYATGKKVVGEPTTVRGHIHEARITVIKDGEVAPRRINEHIDYSQMPVPPGTRERSLATPLDMQISSDGKTLYLAAFGSAKIGVLDAMALEQDRFTPSSDDHIELPGGGPAGMVLDESRGRLYVLTRFDNTVNAIDLERREVVQRSPLHNPEPPSIVVGRPFLYDARMTSSNGEASCSSCHVFGDMDDLAWDLGDPDGSVMPNPNPVAVKGKSPPFHPIKGPMTTQTFHGLRDTGPLHWRGDRTGGNDEPPGDPLDSYAGFQAFNVAFGGLVGRDEGPFSYADMQKFTEFGMQITPPPNPIRRLDNSLRKDEALGFELYNTFPGPDFVMCDTCHELNPGKGFFGTAGKSNGVDLSQEFKTPQLRNAYQKVGKFGMAASSFFINDDNGHKGPQIRGYGFIHDGSIDTTFRFFRANQFKRFEHLGGNATRRNAEAFIMAYPSNLAPIVGQQVTLDARSPAAVGERIDLMLERASTDFAMKGAPGAKECDLVAQFANSKTSRGYVRRTDGLFHPSDGSEAVSDAALRGLVARSGSITYTCAPPGTGTRKAIDRDTDGRLDALDNCPARSNADQLDADEDGHGDACDPSVASMASSLPN
jgi:DNA-binding beta-propeller fold protein YncE